MLDNVDRFHGHFLGYEMFKIVVSRFEQVKAIEI